MTANNTTPFMAQKKVDKRKFVEGVLHLSVFGEMLLQVRSDLNDAKKNNEIISSSFSEKQKNLETYRRQHTKIEDNKKQKIEVLKDRQLNNIQKIAQISSLDFASLEANKNSLEQSNTKRDLKIKELKLLATECQQNYEILRKEELTLLVNKENLIKERDLFLDKTKTCPTCKRSYNDQNHEHIKILLEELNFKIKENDSKNQTVSKQIKAHQKSCDKIQETISQILGLIKKDKDEILKISLLAQDVKHLTEINNTLDKEIEEWNNSTNEFDPIIEETIAKIAETEESLDLLQKKIQILESAKFVVSEEGVKTYIIKKMLTLLNAKLNFYLQALEAPCKCEFNEMFEETIFNDKGLECSYFNFSGGERKRIDLAILFMFQDLLRVQTGTSFSLSMYDELFDSALDEKGVDKILGILKERVEKYNESIYIVSHNKTAVRSGIDQILLLEKIDGTTRLVQ
jgi:DNA repair exonuclease SbcCD ATPase subunit